MHLLRGLVRLSARLLAFVWYPRPEGNAVPRSLQQVYALGPTVVLLSSYERGTPACVMQWWGSERDRIAMHPTYGDIEFWIS